MKSETVYIESETKTYDIKDINVGIVRVQTDEEKKEDNYLYEEL